MGRSAFGITWIRQHIFVIGGVSEFQRKIPNERYDILGDQWSNYDPPLDIDLVAPNAFKVSERFIFLIGGLNYMHHFMSQSCMEQKLLMLDTECPDEGWQSIPFKGLVFPY